MGNQLKRALSLVMALVMALSCMSLPAFATGEEPQEPGGPFTVTFDPNHGSAIQTPTVEVGAGETVSAPDQKLQRIGYTFAGWKAEDAEKNWDFGNDTVNADTTLVAQWSKDNNYFDDSNDEVRIAGQIDLFGADLRSYKDYSGSITIYRGYEGFSSNEIAEIRITKRNYEGGEYVNTDENILNVDNVTLSDPDISVSGLSYDGVYNVLQSLLKNYIAKNNWVIQSGDAAATYTATYTEDDYGYSSVHATVSSGDMADVISAITNKENYTFETTSGYDWEVYFPAGSYFSMNGRGQTIGEGGVTAPLLVNGGFDLEAFRTAFFDGGLSAVTDMENKGSFYLYLKSGAYVTYDTEKITLDKDVAVTVTGLGNTESILSLLNDEHPNGVEWDDISSLLTILPQNSTITTTVTFGEEESDVDTNFQAYIYRNGVQIGETGYSFADVIASSNNATDIKDGDTIKLNPNYIDQAHLTTGVISLTKASGTAYAFGTTYPPNVNNLTLDLNGCTLTSSSTQTISLNAGRTLNIINSSDSPATLENTNKTGIAIRSPGGSVHIGGTDANSVQIGGGITIVGATAIKSDNNAAAINIYGGTFKNTLNQNKGKITITGGTFDHDPSAYVDDGYAAVKTGNVWTVGETTTTDAGGVTTSTTTVTVGDTTYTTVETTETVDNTTITATTTTETTGTTTAASTVISDETQNVEVLVTGTQLIGENVTSSDAQVQAADDYVYIQTTSGNTVESSKQVPIQAIAQATTDTTGVTTKPSTSVEDAAANYNTAKIVKDLAVAVKKANAQNTITDTTSIGYGMEIKPVAETQDTGIYEIHPVAIAYHNGDEIGRAEIDVSGTGRTYLAPVPASGITTAYAKVTHYGATAAENEEHIAKVVDGVAMTTVSHFSKFSAQAYSGTPAYALTLANAQEPAYYYDSQDDWAEVVADALANEDSVITLYCDAGGVKLADGQELKVLTTLIPNSELYYQTPAVDSASDAYRVTETVTTDSDSELHTYTCGAVAEASSFTVGGTVTGEEPFIKNDYTESQTITIPVTISTGTESFYGASFGVSCVTNVFSGVSFEPAAGFNKVSKNSSDPEPISSGSHFAVVHHQPQHNDGNTPVTIGTLKLTVKSGATDSFDDLLDGLTTVTINDVTLNTDAAHQNTTAVSSATVQVPFKYLVTVVADPAAGATLTVDGNSAYYTAGTQLSIAGTPNTGYHVASPAWTRGTDDAGTFSDNTAGNTTFTVGCGNATLTYHTVVNTYKLYTNVNYGDAENEYVADITYGNKVTVPAAPQRTGYTFSAWYLNQEGTGSAFTPATNVNVSELAGITQNGGDVVLYAQWTKDTYTISYDLNGGMIEGTSANPTNYSVDTDTFTLNNPTKTGYTFTGWSGTGLNEATVNVTIPSGSTGNRSYTANWTPNTYTVTFNPNGGNATSPASKTVTYDSAYGELPTATRNGYTFVGWYTDATNGTQVTSSNTVKITADQILYAHWTANSYKVAFNANGGSGTMEEQSFTYGTSAKLTANAFTKTGYEFAGWKAENSGDLIANSASFSIDSYVTVSTEANATVVTLVAQWTAKKYTVTFNSNGGNATSPASKQVTYDSAYGELPTATRNGYTFVGWFTEEIEGTKVTAETPVKITADQTLYAHWTVIEYSITYMLNNGQWNAFTPTTTYTVETPVTLPVAANIAKTGHTFNGWYLDDQFSGDPVAEIAVHSTGDKIVYAKWTPNPHTVTFSFLDTANNDQAVGQASAQYDYGHALTESEIPEVPTGYALETNAYSTDDGTNWTNTVVGFTVPDSDPTILVKLHRTYTVTSEDLANNYPKVATSKDDYTATIKNYEPDKYTYTTTITDGTNGPTEGTIDEDGNVTFTAAQLKTFPAGANLTITVTKKLANVHTNAYAYVYGTRATVALITAWSTANVPLTYKGVPMWKETRVGKQSIGATDDLDVYVILVDMSKAGLTEDALVADYAATNALIDISTVDAVETTANTGNYQYAEYNANLSTTTRIDVSDVTLIYNVVTGQYAYTANNVTGVLTARDQQYLLSDATLADGDPYDAGTGAYHEKEQVNIADVAAEYKVIYPTSGN